MRLRRADFLILVAMAVVAAACSPEQPRQDDGVIADIGDARNLPERVYEISPDTISGAAGHVPLGPADRRAFFGDLHVHTTYSFDAFAFGTTAGPRDAYRFARGGRLEHPSGFDMKLREPLDFYAVTDHAMFLGLAQEGSDTSTEFSRHPVTEPLHGLNDGSNDGLTSLPRRFRAFGGFIPGVLAATSDGSLSDELRVRVAKRAWSDIVSAADEYYEPGSFTTFAAYEYTSSTNDRGNLHRNVIFRDTAKLPAEPFSRFHDQNPEGLWDWMDSLRAQGIESLAIPHNSNGSNGQMFKLVDWAGSPLDDAYAERRMRNEPIVEITQIKGTSETHPSLSDTDEWANFEITPYRVATMLQSEPKGGYVRDALIEGIALASQGIENPYHFGFIGSSDTHTGATAVEESDFHGKLGLLDATPVLKGSVPMPRWQAWIGRYAVPDQIGEVEGVPYINAPTPTFGAAGLAAVWAEENTRPSIYDAMRRKEAFATSGPRIRVRLFAGFDYAEGVVDRTDGVALAYEGGVPMGADLEALPGRVPTLLAWALADPHSAKLQRLQIVKGWIGTDGSKNEVVYDVACAGGKAPSASTQRCPDNGAKVDLETCKATARTGASELRAQWSDPDFDPAERAFYYVRALENPTCRWSTWDALREDAALRPDLEPTLQERAWSSPIWIEPAAQGS